jgi:hypothetical protein
MCLEDRPVLVANAGGIDIGAREIFVAVPPDRDPEPVRVFGTFTEDLERMADWLLRSSVTTVAMESTGVYWIPVYEILEAKGVTPCLVDASHMKNVPGRRTDWHECQWLQYLHSVGLLRAAFRPDEKGLCRTRPGAAPRRVGGDGEPTRPTHAKGTDANEFSNSTRDQ